jgi:hypothetical protein
MMQSPPAMHVEHLVLQAASLAPFSATLIDAVLLAAH